MQKIFVCVTLIGVKSQYGSCSRNCTEMINLFLDLYLCLYSLMVKHNTVNIWVECSNHSKGLVF